MGRPSWHKGKYIRCDICGYEFIGEYEGKIRKQRGMNVCDSSINDCYDSKTTQEMEEERIRRIR